MLFSQGPLRPCCQRCPARTVGGMGCFFSPVVGKRYATNRGKYVLGLLPNRFTLNSLGRLKKMIVLQRLTRLPRPILVNEVESLAQGRMRSPPCRIQPSVPWHPQDPLCQLHERCRRRMIVAGKLQGRTGRPRALDGARNAKSAGKSKSIATRSRAAKSGAVKRCHPC